MNAEALIELISRRVIEQLLKADSCDVAPVKRQSVLVVGESFDSAMLGEGFDVSFLKDVDQASAADFDHIVVSDLPNKLLGDMAIGLERGNDGCVIVESLMLGKTVYILEEGIAYRRFKETAKPAFYQLFQEKEQALISYGMDVVAADSLGKALKGNTESTLAVPAAAETVLDVVSEAAFEGVAAEEGAVEEAPRKKECKRSLIIEKRVVSERDLRIGSEQGYTRFAIMEKSLLTPLANDFIREKELHVDRV